MNLAVKVALVTIIVLVVLGVALRARKLRRDELHERGARRDRGPLAPPPSPYAASKGFRLIDAAGNPTEPTRPEPPRPRLEPDRDYVFGEAQLGSFEEVSPPTTRHDERWALERSLHRPRVPMRPRVIVTVVIVLVVLLAMVVYAMKGRHGAPSSTSSTTSSVAVSVALPVHALASARRYRDGARTAMIGTGASGWS
ncbi:MAG TPA: hypothetical protein VMV53_09770 [Acidimicrobiales bacterium]|nr:hypothetical protein [Acidimicrobiales bacterium]